jgi:hypothetical protein
LLGHHKELENQEIYFAAPEELNDPMEGFKDIYWHGDEVVWENLIKHYLLCLEHVCSLFIIGDMVTNIVTKDIPVFKTEEWLPTPQYRQLFKEIRDKFFGNDSIGQYPKNLSRRSTPVRRSELLMYIKLLHAYALDTIFTAYESHNLIAKRSEIFYQMAKKALLDSEALFNAANKTEAKHPNNEYATDTFFSLAIYTATQLDLITRYNSPSPDNGNKAFVFLNFPEEYIHAIEKLIYPDWYTACFIAKCDNSSVWGHYGDKHRGVCLSFKAEPENDNVFIKLHGVNGWNNSGPTYGKTKHTFFKIDYEKKPVEVDFFRSLGCLPRPVLTKFWYANENGLRSACADDLFDAEEQWRDKHWTNFYKGTTTKLKDWKYEEEYRLILSSSLQDIGDPAIRKLKYDFDALESITFGIKTAIEDKVKIMKIIEAKCQSKNRKDFKFYQAYYSSQKGSIDRFEMSMIKFADDKVAL